MLEAKKRLYMTKRWVFTQKRKQSLAKAQKRHVQLVEAGKRALAK